MRVCLGDWRGSEAGQYPKRKMMQHSQEWMALFFMASSARYRSSRETSEATSFRRWSVLSLPSGRSTDPGAAADAEAVGLERPEAEVAIVV